MNSLPSSRIITSIRVKLEEHAETSHLRQAFNDQHQTAEIPSGGCQSRVDKKSGHPTQHLFIRLEPADPRAGKPTRNVALREAPEAIASHGVRRGPHGL